jgi:hypothetical protein
VNARKRAKTNVPGWRPIQSTRPGVLFWIQNYSMLRADVASSDCMRQMAFNLSEAPDRTP